MLTLIPFISMVFLACTCFLSQVLEFTYFFPLIPKAGGPDCFAEPQIQAEQSGRSLYTFFLRFNLSYPNFYYSFSFSASQSLNLYVYYDGLAVPSKSVKRCGFTSIARVFCHPLLVERVVKVSLRFLKYRYVLL